MEEITKIEELERRVIDYIFNLSSRPSWVKEDNIGVLFEGDFLHIIMFGNYHIKLYTDGNDTAYCDCDGYNKQDLKYTAEIMDNRDEILELAQLSVEREKIYLLQIRIDFPDGNNQDRTIGYTTKEKALAAWRKEVNEFQRNYEEDIVLDNIEEDDALMNRQGVEAHIWVEGLKIEE